MERGGPAIYAVEPERPEVRQSTSQGGRTRAGEPKPLRRPSHSRAAGLEESSPQGRAPRRGPDWYRRLACRRFHRSHKMSPMNRALLLGVLLAAIAFGAAGASAPLGQQDVFISGQGGYHTYRIPALIVTSNQTMLAFCEGRKNSRSDTGDIDLLLKRSKSMSP